MSRRGEGVTIREVAEAAGVARSSVSRAFTRPDMLSPETVERIRIAAARLGYVPNHLARGLSTGRYGNLAMIVPDIANPFFPPMIRAVQDEADAHDLCVFLRDSKENADREGRLVERMIGQVEGLILASSRMSEERVRGVAAVRPVVRLNRDIEGVPRVPIVSSHGIREALDHLEARGHRRIVYLSGPSASWSNRSRLTALTGAAERCGVELMVREIGVASFEAGFDAAAWVETTGATAVVAFDDLTAHGVMSGLISRGAAVPGDVAVVGCDDVLGGRTAPTLTSISSPTLTAGREAVSLLRELLVSSERRDRRLAVRTRLILRDSA